MQPLDDRLLELLDEEGGLTPQVIEERGITSSDHASRRCRQLARYGLLSRPARGFYKITEEGRAYLAGDLDADDLEPVDES